MPRRDRGSLGRTRTVSGTRLARPDDREQHLCVLGFFYALPQRTDPLGSRQEDAGKIHETLISPPVDMLRFPSHTCTCSLSSVAGFVRRRDSRCECMSASAGNRSQSYLIIEGRGLSFLPPGETNISRPAPLYPILTASRSTRECAASACSCKGLQTEKPLPSRSLTEFPNHTNYKFRLDSFMVGGISGGRAARPNPHVQRICPLFSPADRISLRHFVRLFHNHFKLGRPERPGDIHVATGLVSFVAGRSVFAAVAVLTAPCFFAYRLGLNPRERVSGSFPFLFCTRADATISTSNV